MQVPYGTADWRSLGWKFRLGDIDVTKGASAALRANSPESTSPVAVLLELIKRHAHGDWGEVDAFMKRLNNDLAVASIFPVRSIYRLADGSVIWVLTVRRVTTDGVLPRTVVMVPEEFKEANLVTIVSSVPGAVDTQQAESSAKEEADGSAHSL